MTRYWNDFNCLDISEDEYLEHFGVAGMHWGVRRYQNKDGSLTAAGKRKYMKYANTIAKAQRKGDRAAGKYNEAVKWEMSRPHYYRTMGEMAYSAYINQPKIDINKGKSVVAQRKVERTAKKINSLRKKLNMPLSQAYTLLSDEKYSRVIDYLDK